MATVNKRQLVEMMSREILNNVSKQIRMLVREELDLERDRMKRSILKEIRNELSSQNKGIDPPRYNTSVQLASSRESRDTSRGPKNNIVHKKYTGDSSLDEILNETRINADTASVLGFGVPVDAQDLSFNDIVNDEIEEKPVRHSINEVVAKRNAVPNRNGRQSLDSLIEQSSSEWSELVDRMEEISKEHKKNGGNDGALFEHGINNTSALYDKREIDKQKVALNIPGI